MPHKPETHLVARILRALRDEFGGYWVKIGGEGPFQRAGLPDIFGCCHGLFFGLEVKLPGGDYDPLQRIEAQHISFSGGTSACVHSPSEACIVVREALRGAKARVRVRRDA